MASTKEQLDQLIEQLKRNEISTEEFERRSAELVESLGETHVPSASDAQVSERFRVAEKIARNL